ncbi:hypothetical protein Hamer_G004239, partial [Homarus americanus]
MSTVCGSAPKVVPQADGGLLVEVLSLEMSNKFKTLQCIGGTTVSCSPHINMNQTQGVVYCTQLLGRNPSAGVCGSR